MTKRTRCLLLDFSGIWWNARQESREPILGFQSIIASTTSCTSSSPRKSMRLTKFNVNKTRKTKKIKGSKIKRSSTKHYRSTTLRFLLVVIRTRMPNLNCSKLIERTKRNKGLRGGKIAEQIMLNNRLWDGTTVSHPKTKKTLTTSKIGLIHRKKMRFLKMKSGLRTMKDSWSCQSSTRKPSRTDTSRLWIRLTQPKIVPMSKRKAQKSCLMECRTNSKMSITWLSQSLIKIIKVNLFSKDSLVTHRFLSY